MNSIELKFGDVREKSITTPNQFVSHMLEHIAWRLGAQIKLVWNNTDWQALGLALGAEIAKFSPNQKQSVAFGMIDDGGAEVLIDVNRKGLKLDSVKNTDLDWFLSARCEQLSSGKPLIDLLQGLAQGIGAKIEIRICSYEDPHHTWESVFRGVGMALNKIYSGSAAIEFNRDVSLNSAVVNRQTAETRIKAKIDFNSKQRNKILVSVGNSVNVSGLDKLLRLMTNQARFRLGVDFEAKVLSSSHVVWEDIGLALGRALLDVFKLRMEKIGVNGAGSNLKSAEDLKFRPVTIGLSVEGRKFFKIVPVSIDYQIIRKKLLLGQNVFGNLRSEDLDDFLDGLCGGMGCSLIIIVKKLTSPEEFWKAVFTALGQAIKEAFLPNLYRKGVPPGVKANLS